MKTRQRLGLLVLGIVFGVLALVLGSAFWRAAGHTASAAQAGAASDGAQQSSANVPHLAAADVPLIQLSRADVGQGSSRAVQIGGHTPVYHLDMNALGWQTAPDAATARQQADLAAQRLSLPDLRRTVAALSRTETLGASLADSTAELAASVRAARRAAVTERARTAPVKMLFPLGVPRPPRVPPPHGGARAAHHPAVHPLRGGERCCCCTARVPSRAGRLSSRGGPDDRRVCAGDPRRGGGRRRVDRVGAFVGQAAGVLRPDHRQRRRRMPTRPDRSQTRQRRRGVRAGAAAPARRGAVTRPGRPAGSGSVADRSGGARGGARRRARGRRGRGPGGGARRRPGPRPGARGASSHPSGNPGRSGHGVRQLRRGRPRAPDRLALRRRRSVSTRAPPTGRSSREERAGVGLDRRGRDHRARIGAVCLGVADVARVLVARAHARTAADAAALAVAQELALPSGMAPADVAADYAVRNDAILSGLRLRGRHVRRDGDRVDRRRRIPAGHGPEDGHGTRPSGRGSAGRTASEIAILDHGSATQD